MVVMEAPLRAPDQLAQHQLAEAVLAVELAPLVQQDQLEQQDSLVWVDQAVLQELQAQR